MSNYYDPRFLKHLDINKMTNICEVGARYGDETLELANIFKNANIISFECNPNTVDICRNKLKKHTNIKFFDYGLGDTNQIKPFYSYMNNNDGASSFYKRIDGDSTQQLTGFIKIKKLQDILESENIPKLDLLCLDVQGSELDILKGVNMQNIHYIILEEPLQIINTTYLPENIHSKYINTPTASDIHTFMSNHNFKEIERIKENDIEDNVMYKNILFTNNLQ